MKNLDEIQPDVFTEEELSAFIEADRIEALKDKTKDTLSNLKVELRNVEFDANETAQNNMTSVLAIANWQFNANISTTLTQVANNPNTDEVTKAMLSGLATIFDGLYQGVYKQKIFWKGADNKSHEVQAETIAEALYKAMKMKANIIEETTKNA